MNSLGLQGNVRPYLSVTNGQRVLEPLPDLLFAPEASRLELTHILGAAEGFETTIHQEGGATMFVVRSDSGTVMLVFDDDSDSLVTIVPLHEPGKRVLN